MRVVFCWIVSLLLLTNACYTVEHRAENQKELSWLDSLSAEHVFQFQLGSVCQKENEKQVIDFSDSTRLGRRQIQLLCKEERTKEIRLELKPGPLSCDSLFHLIQTHFDARIHPNAGNNSYSTWRCGSSQGRLIEIELLNEARLYQEQAVSLRWRLHTNRYYEGSQ